MKAPLSLIVFVSLNLLGWLILPWQAMAWITGTSMVSIIVDVLLRAVSEDGIQGL